MDAEEVVRGRGRKRSPGRAPGPGGRDAGERAQRLLIALWALVGSFFGFALGVYLVLGAGWSGGLLVPAAGAVLVWVVVYLGVRGLTSAAGSFSTQLYMPSAGLGPRIDHSLADSLEARGRYEEAVAAHEATVTRHPHAVEAYLRAARILRDRLDDPEGAERWLKRARREAAPTDVQARLLARELVELHTRHGAAERAAPELARLAELAVGTPEGDWARTELARLKEGLPRERG